MTPTTPQRPCKLVQLPGVWVRGVQPALAGLWSRAVALPAAILCSPQRPGVLTPSRRVPVRAELKRQADQPEKSAFSGAAGAAEARSTAGQKARSIHCDRRQVPLAFQNFFQGQHPHGNIAMQPSAHWI
jgi:hypothetical protein